MSLFESPDEELKMDISENTNTESPPLFASPDERLFTTSSSSNTISSHAPPAPHIENLDTLMYNDEKLEEIVNTVTKNMNSLTTSNDSHLKDDLTNRNPGLTPVNSHPLMMMNRDSEESEDSFNRVTNFPDVVPEIEQKHQPLRLANPNPVIQSNTSTTTKSLDVLNNSKRSPRKAFYREPSPDLNDFSDSEPDISQYQAEVGSTFQTVALVSNQPVSRMHQSSSSPKSLNSDHRRKIPLSDDLKADELSLSSLSNQSIDFKDEDDMDDDLDPPPKPKLSSAIMSPSTSTAGDPKLVNGNFLQSASTSSAQVINSNPSERIPEYSAADEARNVRNFQLITLPDGKTREIDMKVIEPYKRILSHGGYLKAGGHNAIIVFSACHLPDRSRADYNYVMNNLFYYVVKTLEQLVTEDYVLVYLHGGSNRKNSPPFPWLKKCYQLLDRRLRKSLKSCYVVHPTFWLKSLVWMTRPFISTKFWCKLVYVKSLDELYGLVPVEKNSIPEKVISYNCRHS